MKSSGEQNSKQMFILLFYSIFSIVEQIFGLYSFGTMVWEFAMILSHGLNVIMFEMYPAGTASTFLVGIVLTSQYFLMSFISTKKVQDSLYKKYKIGDSLYNSKWYALDKCDKRTILQIILMTQKDKAMKVGGFGESNLERFVKVR